MTKKCEWCGKIFETELYNKKFCCKKCKSRHDHYKEAERRRQQIPIEKRMERLKQKSSLVERSIQAKQMGISYGKLMAMVYDARERGK